MPRLYRKRSLRLLNLARISPPITILVYIPSSRSISLNLRWPRNLRSWRFRPAANIRLASTARVLHKHPHMIWVAGPTHQVVLGLSTSQALTAEVAGGWNGVQHSDTAQRNGVAIAPRKFGILNPNPQLFNHN